MREPTSQRADSPDKPPIDPRRYRRVSAFFARAFLRILWSDFVLRLPVLRWFRTDPVQRWVGIARRFRALALELGGVQIKLGQYLSARVDILPFEVTRELSGLQDEVPPADINEVARQIEEDLGHPLQELFPVFHEVPLGAASLAQVHEAALPDGRSVVVKVLRPGIDVLVETDLAAIGRAIRWIRWWRFVRQRVDLDWLEREFSETTRRELDLRAEGRSAERFAESFRDDPDVYLPKIYWQRTGRRTLTEENVAFLKITDREGMRERGIDPAEVARQLYRVYMRQIFVHHFVHADPHPGNLFVRPVEGGFGSDPKPAGDERTVSSQIVFVDFGMVAEIPPRLRAALRRFVIGLGSRDAALVVQALQEAGYLLPGADLVQLEEALEAVFDRFWGIEAGRLGHLVLSEAGQLWKEFGRLILETPIQVQVDLMFTGRAVELLSALTTDLDTGFNPWTELAPFAEALAADAADKDWSVRATEVFEQARGLVELPAELRRAAQLARRGRLTVRTALTPETRRRLRVLEVSVGRLSDSVLCGAVWIGGALLVTAERVDWGAGMMAGAVVLWLVLRWRH